MMVINFKGYSLIGVAFLLLAALASWFIVVFARGFGPGVQDYEFWLNEICLLHRNSVHEVYIRCEGIENRIEPKLVEIGLNDGYLVAVTNPVTRENSSNSNSTYLIPDTDVVYWWIIDFSNNTLYGPIDDEESYKLKRSELFISPELLSIPLDDFFEKRR